MRVRLIAIALLAAGTVGLGGMAATTGANAQPGSTPDTYVTYWDTVGSQAFTASGLAAPEGFVIFANVDIAVYDSLMAIRGRLSAVRGRRRGARRGLGRGGCGRGGS